MITKPLLAASLSVMVLATACGGGDASAPDPTINQSTHAPGATTVVELTTAPSATPGDPDAALAHFEAGVTLQLNGRLEEAIAEYGEAIRLDPGSASAFYINRGNAYNELGQFQRAI